MRSSLFIVLAAALLAATELVAAEARFTPAQLEHDLDFITSEILSNHPDQRHSFDAEKLHAAVRALRERLAETLTRDEAWRAFAMLNPELADGHLFVALPDWRVEAAEYRGRGGTLFPYEVQIADDGTLRVRSLLGGAGTPLAGMRITSIDGVDSREISASLIARAHGDTPLFRAELVSRRFWFYYWKLYGSKPAFQITFEDRAAESVPAARAMPEFLADEASFERQFAFEPLGCHDALLTLSTFSWPDKEQFLAFTRRAFTRLKDQRIRTLIIDVRDNGGGDDDLWIEGVLPYLADKPYRWGSTYRKRVLEQTRDEGETVGEVVNGEIDRWIPPAPGNPLRFSGRVHLLVGASTYSSAVLLSNVIQDFDFGTVAGGRPAARARQSGGVQRSVLPNTGLVLYWPRFVLERPARPGDTLLVSPDILVRDDPLDPRAAVLHLVAREAPACAQREMAAIFDRAE